MKTKQVACFIVSSLFATACYNEAVTDDGAGGSSATTTTTANGGSGGGSNGGNCPDIGDRCSSEGASCDAADLTCHCGQWVQSDDANKQCIDQDPTTCVAGKACGSTNEGKSCGGFTCHCGMWMTDDMMKLVTCDGGGNTSSSSSSSGSTSSSSSSSGNTGGSCSGTYLVWVHVHAYAYHVWCEGGFVQAFAPDVADQLIAWLGPWQSLGNDVFGPKMPPDNHPGAEWLDYYTVVEVPCGASIRLQCYLNTNGTETSGDNVRYTFAAPLMFTNGEYVEVKHNNVKVYPPEGAKAFLVQNLDPQGFAENLQINP